jgi:uncharacterized membrane protein YdbT with pleckstrin-like domain
LSISFVSAYASTWAQISQSKQGWKEKLRCTVCSRNSLFITFITNTSISPIIYPQSKLRLNIVLPLGQFLHSAMPCALMFGEASDWWMKGSLIFAPIFWVIFLFELWSYNLLANTTLPPFYNCIVSESGNLEHILVDQSPLVRLPIFLSFRMILILTS